MALISKDSERTFATYLGAAVDLLSEDLTHDIYKGYDYFYIEGYLVQDQKMFEKALRLAAKAGMKICLDLASYNIVAENVEFFKSLISKYVNILFANEEEIRALTDKLPEEGANEIKELCDIVVIKLGAEGSFCVCDDGMVRIGVRPAKALDTTGAGDLYSAGFIYGHMKGLSAEICGKMGAVLSGRVIELIGAKMDEANWENLRREIASLEA